MRFTIVSFLIVLLNTPFCHSQSIWDIKKSKEYYLIKNDNGEVLVQSVKKHPIGLNYDLSKIRSIYVDYNNIPVAYIKDEILIITSNFFELNDFLKEYSLKYSKYELRENQYKVMLSESSEEEIIEIIRILSGKSFVSVVEPNFYFIEDGFNDPMFSSQWNLESQSGGIYINEAHLVTKGCGSIIVGVADSGVEKNHPDLNSNIFSTHYDVFLDEEGIFVGEPGCPGGEGCAHGTAVAGIISAEENNIGIRGISPNSKISSIVMDKGLLVSKTTESYQRIFDWSASNDIDIINCSWHIPSPENFNSNLIELAIDNAITNGRGGLGCIIIFGTGNSNLDALLYPSSYSPVIAVGANNQQGNRWSTPSCVSLNEKGSHYGQSLDIVAPGGRDNNCDPHIPSLDLLGTDGYNTNTSANGGDYTNFGGTSAAAPHVSGVAALILSLNDGFTGQEVKEILLRSAEKTGGYDYGTLREYGGWNEEMGYGKLNAYEALLEATFKGPDVLYKSCGLTYEVAIADYWDTPPPNLSWSVGAGLNALINGDEVTFTLKPTANASNSWVEASFDGTCEPITIRKEFDMIIDVSGLSLEEVFVEAEGVCLPNVTSTLKVSETIPGTFYSPSSVTVGAGLQYLGLSGNTISIRPKAGWSPTNSWVKLALSGCSGNISYQVDIPASFGDMELPPFMIAPCPTCLGQEHMFAAYIPGFDNISWSWPTGWTYVSGQGTSLLRLKPKKGAGYVSYVASDDCGGQVSLSRMITPVNCSLYGCGEGSSAPAIASKGRDNTSFSQESYLQVSANFPEAKAYEWEVPTGWDIISGQGTAKVTIDQEGAGEAVVRYLVDSTWLTQQIPLFDFETAARLSSEKSQHVEVTTVPNPGTNRVKVTMNPSVETPGTIYVVRLISMDHQLMYSGTTTTGGLEINTMPLPEGLYILQVINTNGDLMSVKKLYINKQ